MSLRALRNQLGVASPVLAAAIIASWLIVSLAHTGGLAVVIHNQTLLQYGGATAATVVRDGEWWRLVTSQFVHVYLPHAVLNAAAVAVVGSQLERVIGTTRLLFAYVLAGTAGQLAAITAAPAVVATGASQAAIGVSALALLILISRPEEPRVGFAAPTAYLAIQAALDLLSAGRIKLPHAVSFAVGALVGACWLWRSRCTRGWRIRGS